MTLLQLGFQVLVGKSVTQAARGFRAVRAALVLEWRLTLFAVVVVPAHYSAKGWEAGTPKQWSITRGGPEGWAVWPRNPCRDCVPSKWLRLEAWIGDRFEVENDDLRRHDRKVALVTVLASPITETLAIFALLGICLLSVFGKCLMVV